MTQDRRLQSVSMSGNFGITVGQIVCPAHPYFNHVIEGECPCCGARLQRIEVSGVAWGQCTGTGYPYYIIRAVSDEVSE